MIYLFFTISSFSLSKCLFIVYSNQLLGIKKNFIRNNPDLFSPYILYPSPIPCTIATSGPITNLQTTKPIKFGFKNVPNNNYI